MAKFCGKCGAPLEAGDRFCIQCGEPVKTVDEDLTVPIKSSDEKENFKEMNSSENALEKKTGLAARAIRESNKNPEEINESADEADDVLKQMKADNRQHAKSPDENHPDATGPKKEPDKPKTVTLMKNGTDKAKTASPKKNNKTIFIIVGVVIGVFAIGALIYCFATGILPPKTTVPISFKINIDDGYNNDSTPIIAKITDQSDKSKVTYTTFTPEDKNGKEIEMPQGQYEITMISPVNSDCSIYDMGKAVIIDTSIKEERKVDTSCKRIAADNVTSSQIQSIADALKEASDNENVDIPENTLTRANDRVKTKQAKEEEQRKAAEKQAAIDNAIAQGYDQIVTGKIVMLDDKASVDNYFPDNLKYGNAMSGSYKTPYALLCFDSSQDINALGYGSPAHVKQVTEINLQTDPESWRAYDGQIVTVAINTNDGHWPSGLNPLQMTANFKNAMFVWKD